MPSSDLTHFDNYSTQTRAKHGILRAYLPAYLTALKNVVAGFHYIDGFAGRGRYAAENPGSPLLVLDLLGEGGVAERAAMSLVEAVPAFCQELGAAVSAHSVTARLSYAPVIRHGLFATFIDELLQHPVYASSGKIATFAFIDPCGIDGVRMKDLRQILDLQFGEVLLFFNYDGVNRLLGGLEKGTTDAAGLVEMFGAETAVSELRDKLRAAASPQDRETKIRDAFVGALRMFTHAQYFVPFRFDAKSQERTSHYLVHCASSPLAFKIMKHVMTEQGREVTEKYGKLEFLTDRERGVQFKLFRRDIDEQKQRILERLWKSPCKVSEFTKNWLSKPTDPYSERTYKQMLLDLEVEERVSVFDKNNVAPRPVSKRVRSGRPTMSDELWLRAIR